MDVLTAIAARHSTRSFSDQPLPRDVLERIVDAGRLGPTASNVQPWEFIVVTDRERRAQLAELASNGRFMADAPACVAVFCKDTKYYLEDGCIASTNMLLAATALGVESCWVAGDKKRYCEAVSRLLCVPAAYKLVSLLAFGYAKGIEDPSVKRPLSEALHWEKFRAG